MIGSLELVTYLCKYAPYCSTAENCYTPFMRSRKDETIEKDDEVVKGVPFYAGMKLYKSGKWVYDITPEEQPYIDVKKVCHSIFAVSADRPNGNIIRTLKKMVAEGLALYAVALFNKYKGERESKERKEQIEKGIAALLKAGSLTQSPFHYFQAGQLAEAIKDEPAIGGIYDYVLTLCKEQNIQDTDEIVQLVKQKLQDHYERIGLRRDRA